MPTLELQLQLDDLTTEQPSKLPETNSNDDQRRIEAAHKIAKLNPLEAEDREEELTRWDKLVEYSRSYNPEVSEPAQALLFEAISPTVKQAVGSRLKTSDPRRIEDPYQETMSKILQKGILEEQYKKGNFLGWVNTVARNAAVSSVKSSSKHKAKYSFLSLDMEGGFGDTISDNIPSNDNVEEEAFAIKPGEFAKLMKESGINERFQQIVYLYAIEEQTYEEIANTLNIPKGNVCSGLSRARKKMKVALKKNPNLMDSLRP